MVASQLACVTATAESRPRVIPYEPPLHLSVYYKRIPPEVVSPYPVTYISSLVSCSLSLYCSNSCLFAAILFFMSQCPHTLG